METFVMGFVVMAVAVVAMAVGAIVRGRSLKGSCGGLGAISGLEGSCEFCANEGRCRRKKRAAGGAGTLEHRSVS